MQVASVMGTATSAMFSGSKSLRRLACCKCSPPHSEHHTHLYLYVCKRRSDLYCTYPHIPSQRVAPQHTHARTYSRTHTRIHTHTHTLHSLHLLPLHSIKLVFASCMPTRCLDQWWKDSSHKEGTTKQLLLDTASEGGCQTNEV